MTYSLKYDTLLTSIERGDSRDTINLFKSSAYDVNIEISYIFEDRRQYTITPLYWAVRHRRPKICHYLLRNGANPYHHLVYEYYPLHEACDRGYDDIVQEFVDAKCDLNRVTNDMDTPLHIACVRSHIECVHILLRAGADCNLRNKMLRTPLQEALYHNHHELIKLFEAYDQANFRDLSPPCSQQLSRTTRAKSPNPTATTTVAMTMTTSAQLQRSHSLNEPRGGNPASAPLVQNSTSRPHSVILEDTGSSSALVVTGALQLPLTSRRRSFSQQYLPSSSTYSCTQPNVTGLTNSSAMLSHSLQSLPTHTTQLSATATESPSPVETDGIVPKNVVSAAAIASKSQSQGVFAGSWQDDHSSGKHGLLLQATKVSPVTRHGSCPFPSNGSKTVTPTSDFQVPHERNFHSHMQQKHHPLSAAQKFPQAHHRKHGEKPLCGSVSHPEFYTASASKQELVFGERTVSCDELLLRDRSRKGAGSERRTTALMNLPSPAREKIDHLSRNLMVSLNSVSHFLPVQFKDLFLDSFHRLLKEMASTFDLSLSHYEALAETSSPLPSTPSTPNGTTLPSLLESLSEMKYKLVGEEPLDVRLGSPSPGFASLLFRATLRETQAPSKTDEGELTLMKAMVRVFNMVNQEESKMYYYFKEHPEAILQESTNETSILQLLPPHPNIAGLVHRCRSSTECYAKHIKKLDREDAAVAYTVAPTGEFLFLPYCEKSLAEYLAEQQQQKIVHLSLGITEEDILTILAQLLLGISHLKRHHVAHCAVTPENVLIDERRNVLMLTNFGQAVNLKPQSLEAVRSAITRLQCNSHSRVLAPEVLQSLRSLSAESSYFQENLEKLLGGNDCYAAGRIVYELLSRSLGFCELEHYTQEDIPYLESLSPRCNQILKKLVACDPAERFSALEGAMCCMLLLFGPRAVEMTSLNDCHQWILSESLEFYMKPVLQRSSAEQTSDAGSKLHYIYLTVANPERIWNACRFFNQY